MLDGIDWTAVLPLLLVYEKLHLSKETLARTMRELGQRGFDATVPSLFLSEGLIMYLGAEGKVKLLGDVSTVAAVGSVLVLQFMDATGSDAAKENPAVLNSALSQEEARKELGERGWGDFQFFAFGDDALNFGRFQGDKPNLSFSFCVCKKLS